MLKLWLDILSFKVKERITTYYGEMMVLVCGCMEEWDAVMSDH